MYVKKSEKMNYLTLVNKEHPLKDKLKIDLINVGKKNIYEDVYMERTAGLSLIKMLDDVNKLFDNEKVIVNSGYRSLKKQKEILEYYLEKEGNIAYKRVAMPGTSEHHTGLGIDVSIFINGKYEEDPTGNEESLKWLFENSYKYGFILRYPKNKEDIHGYRYEPWHFRYVGSSKLAKEIKDSGLTLDEYILKKVKTLK